MAIERIEDMKTTVDTSDWPEDDPRFLRLAYDLLIEATTRLEVALERLEPKHVDIEPKTFVNDKTLFNLLRTSRNTKR